jgi:hypothetical protein
MIWRSDAGRAVLGRPWRGGITCRTAYDEQTLEISSSWRELVWMERLVRRHQRG